MSKREDLTGKTFGRLTVIGPHDVITASGKKKLRWDCQCSCENHTLVTVSRHTLIYGKMPSCGCYRLETIGKWNKKYNTWDDEVYSDEFGEYKIGYTHNTNKPFFVDLEDYDKVKDICWYEHHPCPHSPDFFTIVGYIAELKRNVKMHIFLGFKHYDHADHNEANNRKYNLRPMTQLENVRNSKKAINNNSGYIGVSKCPGSAKWRARIMVNYKEIGLGYYDNIDDAIKARLDGELKYFGPDFAPQRHLFEQYGVLTENIEEINNE